MQNDEWLTIFFPLQISLTHVAKTPENNMWHVIVFQELHVTFEEYLHFVGHVSPNFVPFLLYKIAQALAG